MKCAAAAKQFGPKFSEPRCCSFVVSNTTKSVVAPLTDKFYWAAYSQRHENDNQLGGNMKTKNLIAKTTNSNTAVNRLRAGCATRLLPLMLLLTLPAAVQAQFTYNINNGTITITGYTGPGGAVTIPSSILVNGVNMPVTSVGFMAFKWSASLTSVTIPSSVTSIGVEAFDWCISLTNVMIPNSVTNIGDLAFDSCASLINVAIPNSVTSIGDYAFYGCRSLDSNIMIGTNVATIGDGAFAGCSNLMAISVDALNFVYQSVDGVLFNWSQTTLIQCPGGKTGSYIVPNSVTSIGNSAFGSCVSLTNIMISNSVTNIGGDAFADCGSLTSITVPDSVISIEDYAFYSCRSLTNITIGTGITSIGIWAFWNCTSLTSVTIPNCVTNIGGNAFAECIGLTNVTIPNSVTSIGDFAFESCLNLTSVTIGTNVTSIGDQAFYFCRSLTSVTIPNSVTNIGGDAFCNCTGLTNVTLGNSVTSIGDYAFCYCTDLTGVYFQGNAPNLGWDVFYDGNDNATVYYLPGTTGWGPTFGGLSTVVLNSLPSISIKPADQPVFIGDTATFSVTASGTPQLSYQWKFNGTNLSRATNTSLTLTNVQLNQTGNYAVLVTNFYGSILSSNAVLTVNPTLFCDPAPSGLVAMWEAEGNANDNVGANNGFPTVGITYTNGEVGQAFVFNGSTSYISVPASPSLNIGTGDGVTIECWVMPNAFNVNASGPIIEWDSETTDGLQLWTGTSLFANVKDTSDNAHRIEYYVKYNTNSFQHVALTYDKSSGLAILYYNGLAVTNVYFGSIIPQTTYPVNIGRRTGQPIGDGDTYGGLMDELSLYNRALSSNEIAAIYNAGTAGKCQTPTPPIILTQPANQTMTVGGTANFSTTATGSLPLSYQWNFNGTNIVGATNTVLTLTNVQLNQTGNYAVLVTNAFGSILGSNVLLTVLAVPPTIITQPANQTVQLGSTASFSVVAGGSLPLHYQWAFNRTNISGATNTSLTLANVQLNQAGNYAVLVTNAFGMILSSNAILWIQNTSTTNFTYTTNNGTITIMGYIGSGGVMSIPSTINGLPVASIGDWAFYFCTNLTSVTIGNGVISIGSAAFCYCYNLTNVTIPDSITNIGSSAFQYCAALTSVTIPASVTSIGEEPFGWCYSLTAITVDTNNPAYDSPGGVLFNKSQTMLIQYPAAKAGNYAIPNSVTSIGYNAFGGCVSLRSVTVSGSVTNVGEQAFGWCFSLTAITVSTNNPAYSSLSGVLFDKSRTTLIEYPRGKVGVYTIPNSVTNIGDFAFCFCASLSGVTIPNSVTNIGDEAFCGCTSLAGVYFQGNVPSIGSLVFLGDNNTTVYYLPGTTGWGSTFGGRPTAPWNPQVQTGGSFGHQSNQFGFNITGTSNLVIVVEACTNFANPVWQPVRTNTLNGGSCYFSDPQWTNFPGRYYRLRSP
jgi:hypothetical protein